ncbi:MAG TPA: hypothetical protein VD926_15950 [Acidimicrobiales bacterium]|nr:hypothetical protein [Acidimicrobiales bacterium]
MLGGADCERLGDGWLAQPVNALSSLAFVPAGLWVGRRAGLRSGWRRPLLLAFAAVLVANGIGSFAYHGPQPGWAKAAHDLPIPLVGLLLVANEVGRRVDPQGDDAGRALAVAVGLGAAGGAAWLLGRTSASTCDPDSLLQWHALWHLLAAAAATVATDGRVPPRA